LQRRLHGKTLGNSHRLPQTLFMKVARNTDQILIIEDRPVLVTALLGFFFLASFAGAVSGWIASEWLVALVLTFATAFITLCIRLFVRRIQVIFDRPNNTITFRARNMRGYSEIVHLLSDLSHAKKEGHDTARCVLVFDKGMSQGDHPITQYSTSGLAPKQITDAINAWLKPPAPVDSEPPKA
jgi:hypothetical protein